MAVAVKALSENKRKVKAMRWNRISKWGAWAACWLIAGAVAQHTILGRIDFSTLWDYQALIILIWCGGNLANAITLIDLGNKK